jgi:hypothetical protein
MPVAFSRFAIAASRNMTTVFISTCHPVPAGRSGPANDNHTSTTASPQFSFQIMHCLFVRFAG